MFGRGMSLVAGGETVGVGALVGKTMDLILSGAHKQAASKQAAEAKNQNNTAKHLPCSDNGLLPSAGLHLLLTEPP